MSPARPLPVMNSLGKPARQSVALELQEINAEGPVCDAAPYPKIAAGNYLMQCTYAAIYFDPQFKRQVCRLKFMSPEHEGLEIYHFLNMGDGNRRRRSKY